MTEEQINFMYGDIEVDDEGSDAARLRWLEALEAAGVDSWEGVDAASEIYRAFKSK